MPQCPHCQKPYEVGQRYCSTCGSFLMHPEQGDTFCPQCGVRVSPRQEFCHECDAPLKGAQVATEALEPAPESAAPAAAAPEAAPAKVSATGLPSWLIGVLVGAGVLIIILVVLLFSRGTSTPPAPATPPKAEAPAPVPAPKAETPAPAPAAGAPAVTPGQPAAPAPSAAANLKEELQKELAILREAQLHKDIVQFLSVYSLTYPGLDDKRASTLKAWEDYDFTNLVFTVDKIQPIDADNAIATVTWYMDAKNRRTHDLSSTSQTFQVRFGKELGKWRIRSLEEVEQ